MPDGPNLGAQLVAAGWRQGALLPLNAPVQFHEWVVGPPPSWMQKQQSFEGSLVVATQTCDIKRQPSEEPVVELLRAFWTTNPRIVIPAGRNSVRQFLLRDREVDRGREGLVAEAAKRVFVDKRSLLHFTPESGCNADREVAFRRWLARRYDRPAIPDAIVHAVQKPVVDRLRTTSADARLWELLRGVREIMYDTTQQGPPFKVKLLLVRDDGQELSEVDAHELEAWLASTIAAAGDAEVDNWEVASTDEISVKDYLTFVSLPLDEYSA